MTDVSVITATFNPIRAGRDRQLQECIASVAAQRGVSVEQLAVDGGSTDGTPELLAKASENGVLRFTSEPDRGIYDAMNKGAKQAKGEYLAFLNSDDFYGRTDALALAVGFLRQNGADYCCAECRIVPETGMKTRMRHVKMATVFFGMPYCHQSFLIRRDVFEKYGGYDADLRISADYDLSLRLFLGNAKYVEIPEAFAAIRAGGVSADREKAKAEAAKIVLANYRAYCPELTPEGARRIVEAAEFPPGLLEKLLAGRPEAFRKEVVRAVRILRFRAWRRSFAARWFGRDAAQKRGK